MKTKKTITGFAAAGVCALMVLLPLRAETPANSPAASTNPEAPAEQLMLLADHTVVKGFIEETPEGFVLRRKGGKMVYPASRVRFVGDSILDLYLYETNNVPDADASEHYRVYQWCVKHGLQQQAEDELKKVVAVNPNYRGAGARLEKLLSKQEKPSVVLVESPSNAATINPQQLLRSLREGYGEEVVRDFARDVQPVLLKRCATCHANIAYRGEFRLYRRSEGHALDHRLTARNLQAVINQIDFNQPEKSSILYQAVTAHGKAKVSGLGGVNSTYYKDLRDWTFNVADYHFTDKETLAARRRTESEPSSSAFGSDRENAMNAMSRRNSRPQRPVGFGQQTEPGIAPRERVASPFPVADDAPDRDSAPVPKRQPSRSRSDATAKPARDQQPQPPRERDESTDAPRKTPPAPISGLVPKKFPNSRGADHSHLETDTNTGTDTDSDLPRDLSTEMSNDEALAPRHRAEKVPNTTPSEWGISAPKAAPKAAPAETPRGPVDPFDPAQFNQPKELPPAATVPQRISTVENSPAPRKSALPGNGAIPTIPLSEGRNKTFEAIAPPIFVSPRLNQFGRRHADAKAQRESQRAK